MQDMEPFLSLNGGIVSLLGQTIKSVALIDMQHLHYKCVFYACTIN